MAYCILLFCLCLVSTIFGFIKAVTVNETQKEYIPGQSYLPIVKTVYGIIQGQTVVSEDGRYSHEYRGVPYAKPPLGKLRFKKPEPFTRSWPGVLDARRFGPSCMQPRLKLSGRRSIDMWNPRNKFKEDCLTLNIWTPYPRGENMTVMVWIHGDSFIKGSSALKIHNGKTLASHGDVIVVTFNYRLGALGFLTTGDERIQGNMGLHDQRMALSWVKNNINVFGGNPNSVTIFGESSGAASVGLHLLSSRNENLFQRAILQSGSPLAYWASMSKIQAKQRLRDFLSRVNCPDDNSILDCLNHIPADIIVNAQQDLRSVQFGHFTWVPVVDNDIIFDHPRSAIEKLYINNKNVKILLGSSKNEGSRWMVYLLKFLRYKTPFKINKEELRSLIDQVFFELSEAARSYIKEFYLKLEQNRSSPKYNRDLYQIILEDRHMYCPMLDFAKSFSNSGSDVYMYRFKHRANQEDWPKWMGVVHGSDLQYVFGMPVEETNLFTRSERDLSLRMMTYWTNFAKYGNPTSGQKGILPKWPKFRNKMEKFVKFKTMKQLQIGKRFRDSHCKLWQKIETDAFVNHSEKKSSINLAHIVNGTMNFQNDYFYNVF